MFDRKRLAPQLAKTFNFMEGGVGIFGFGYFFFFAFVSKNVGFSVLASVAVCSFSSISPPVFSFQLSSQVLARTCRAAVIRSPMNSGRY